MGPVTLLDASVLYPSLIRNLLMHLVGAGLISARWTDAIHEEWIGNLLADQPDLTPERLQRTRRLMEAAAPGASITGYEDRVLSLTLPDPDDRHVLAAAIAGQVDMIVTWNLKHFPSSIIQRHGVEVLSPDDLMTRLLEEAPEQTQAAIEELRLSFRRPPYSREQLMERFSQVGLLGSARLLYL